MENDIKKIMAHLATCMKRYQLTRIRFKDATVELELEQGPPPALPPASHPHPTPSLAHEIVPAPATTLPVQPGHDVTAPIVGTFYSASRPGAPDLVKVGDWVEEESVIGIIEAMKVMNELRASRKGQVAEIYARNGQPVEFGTKILKII